MIATKKTYTTEYSVLTQEFDDWLVVLKDLHRGLQENHHLLDESAFESYSESATPGAHQPTTRTR